MNRRRAPFHTLLLLLATATIASCADDPRRGWSTASVYPTQYRTVAVNVFQNDTYFREVGFKFGRRLDVGYWQVTLSSARETTRESA